MKRRAVIAPMLLVVVGSLVLAPTLASAGSRGHRGSGGHRLGSHHPGASHGKIQFGGSDFFSDRQPRFANRDFKRSFVHQPVFSAPFVTFAEPAPPVVVYAPPPVVYAPTTVIAVAPVAPPVPVAPPASAIYPAVAVAPEPAPTVVEHPTGRYELRGDGVTTSYAWVWIPNPPPAPPVQPASGEERPPRRTQVYRWTDADGVEHWTDRPPAGPEEPRAPAKRPDT
jgi:hypothetical protein